MLSPRKLQLIVNADDFGESEDTVSATIECFEAGALTSATLMPGMPATERAIAFALQRPEFSYGVHLSFVRDPVDRPLSAPGLVPSRRERCKAAHDQAGAAEGARRASRCRADRAGDRSAGAAVLEQGVAVSHVDSHRHLHKFAPFRAALARALPRLGISRVRTVQDVYLTRPLRSPTYWLGGLWRTRIVRLFETTEHMFMPSRDDPPWAEPLLRRIRDLRRARSRSACILVAGMPWLDRDRRATIEFVDAVRDEVSLVDSRWLGARRGEASMSAVTPSVSVVVPAPEHPSDDRARPAALAGKIALQAEVIVVVDAWSDDG